MREEFEAFVIDELGDVPVIDADRYVSQKINNYWRSWQAATEREALRAALNKILCAKAKDAEIADLEAALHDLLAAWDACPSCQAGVINVCRCVPCATKRARAALAGKAKARGKT
jgi:hypothetical protein